MRQAIPIQSSHIRVQQLLFLMPQAIPISSSHIRFESLSFPPATSNTNFLITWKTQYRKKKKIEHLPSSSPTSPFSSFSSHFSPISTAFKKYNTPNPLFYIHPTPILTSSLFHPKTHKPKYIVPPTINSYAQITHNRTILIICQAVRFFQPIAQSEK